MPVLTPEQAKAEALARFTDPGPDHINCAQAVVRFALSMLGADDDLMKTARYLGGGVAGMGEASASEAHERCRLYVAWMCDHLHPLLLEED